MTSRIFSCSFFLIVILIVIDFPAFAEPKAQNAKRKTRNAATATLRVDRHDDYNPRDLHAIVSTVGIWWQTRFTRMGDAALDTVLPGAPHRPIESSLELVRRGYHSSGLSSYTPTRRTGDLFKVLGLHQLSPSNITFGSHLRRAQGLIDWSQLVIEDCGELVARPLGRRAMDTLKYPYWPIDRVQEGVDRAVHEVAIFVGRIGDRLLFGIEHLADPREKVPVPPPADDLVFSK